MGKHISTILLLFVSTIVVAQSNTDTFTDKRDGNTYTTINIGNQKWMAENLRYLPKVSMVDYGSIYDAFYYVYDCDCDNISSAKENKNYPTYGVLYNWKAAKNACPAGWRLPSKSDWENLVNSLESSQSGSALASKSENWENGALRKSEHWGKSGFNAPPAGYRDGNNFFADEGKTAYFWSSEQVEKGYSYYRYIDKNETFLGQEHGTWENGYSIRCVKN